MSFDDKDVVVKFGADSAGLEQGLKNVSQTVTDATGKMSSGFGQMKDAVTGHVQALSGAFDGLNGMLSGLTSAFAGVAVVLAGGAMFKEAIKAATEEGDEVKKLMNALGMTAEAASKMRISLELVGMSAGDYVGIAMKFDRQLRTNEGSLIALGVVTRDHNGSLLSQEELLKNAADTMMTYKAGTDRNAVAMALFGRSAEEAFKLLKLDDGIKKRADELAKTFGEIVTDKDLKDIKGYKVEMAAVGVVTGSFAENLGQSVIPAMTELAKVFMQVAASVMPVIKAAFDVFSKAVSALGDIFKTVVDDISSLMSFLAKKSSDAIGKSIPDGWLTWENVMKGVATTILVVKDIVIMTIDAILIGMKQLAIFQSTIWSAAGDMLQGKSPVDAIKKGYQEAIVAGQEWNDKQSAMNKKFGDELAGIWFSPKTTGQDGEGKKGKKKYADPNAAKEKAAKEKAEREAAEKLAYEVGRAEIEGARNVAKSLIEVDKEKLDQKLALGEISMQEFLSQTKIFEDRRYEIEKAALAERLELDKKDPKNAAKAKADYASLEVLENVHNAKSIASLTKTILEQRKQWADLFKSIGDGMGKAIGGFIVGTQSLQSALQGIFSSIQQSFANLIGTMISGFLQEQAMSLLNINQTQKEVPVTAASAGGKAAESVAGIPFAGPAMAAAAYASTFAMIMGGLHSASGGYDIPAGVNPLTQLHQNEMVLPAPLATKVRNMTDGRSNRDGDIHVHIHAMDGPSVRRVLMENGGAVHDSLKQQLRNFRR